MPSVVGIVNSRTAKREIRGIIGNLGQRTHAQVEEILDSLSDIAIARRVPRSGRSYGLWVKDDLRETWNAAERKRAFFYWLMAVFFLILSIISMAVYIKKKKL